jgi:plastocyanin
VRFRPLYLILLAAAAALPVAACFSERSDATGPTSGECLVPIDPSVSGSTLVPIRNFAFRASPVRIRVGERVTWVNCEPAGSEAHTSTSDGPEWDSGSLPPGASYTRTFPSAGTFPYHCEPHPFMTATVVVE